MAGSEPAPVVAEQAEVRIALPNGDSLALFTDHVALSASDGTRRLRLSSDTHLQLRRNLVWTHLHIAERSYALTAGKANRCLELIGTGLLRSQRQGAVLSNPFVGPLSSLERAAIEAQLYPRELLLAAHSSEVALRSHSALDGNFQRKAQLVLTDQRLFLLAVARSGAMVLEALSEPFTIKDQKLTTQERGFKIPRSFEALTSCFSLPPEERALAVAQRIREQARGAAHPATERILSELAAREHLPSQWLLWMIRLERGLKPQPTPPWDLDARPVEWWEQWELSREMVQRALRELPQTEPWRTLAQAWAEQAWQRCDADPASEERFLADLEFAEALLQLNNEKRAEAVLRHRRELLPRPVLADADLPGSTPAPSTALRKRLEDLSLRVARGEAQELAALGRQLKLDPLNSETLRAIAELAAPELAQRAKEVERLLCSGSEPHVHDTPLKPHPLPEEVLEERLHDGMSDAQKSLLHRFQTLVATTYRPDFKTLKQYCERITKANAIVPSIVDEAATLLGLGHVDVYISRGANDVGVRAFDDHAPFLLVGGQHLDENSRYHMVPAELRFSIGAELFHLRMGHVRIKPIDVMHGLMDRGKQGLDILLSILPILQGLKLANRLGMVTAKLSLPQIGKLVEATRRVRDTVRESQVDLGPKEISAATEELIAAHQELQLAADRVGILCSGQFVSAIRAILLSRNDYVRAAQELEQCGVLELLSRHRTSHPDAFENLTRRIANLVVFYVSEEFGALRRNVVHRAPEPTS